MSDERYVARCKITHLPRTPRTGMLHLVVGRQPQHSGKGGTQNNSEAPPLGVLIPREYPTYVQNSLAGIQRTAAFFPLFFLLAFCKLYAREMSAMLERHWTNISRFRCKPSTFYALLLVCILCTPTGTCHHDTTCVAQEPCHTMQIFIRHPRKFYTHS